jgi:hypothetical protein
MRKLLTLCLLVTLGLTAPNAQNTFSFTSTGGGTPSATLVASTADGSSGGSGVTSSNINTTGATQIIIFAASSTGATEPTPTDSNTNVWQKLQIQTQATNTMRLAAWMCHNPCTVGSGHNFTISTSSCRCTIGVLAFSALDTPTSNNTNSSTESISTGSSITLPQQVTVGAAAVMTAAARTESVDSGYTISNQVDFSGGLHYGLAIAYEISNAAGTQTPTFTWTGGGNTSTVAMRFLFAE